MKWVYDKEMHEVVTSEEYAKRQSKRSPNHSYELKRKFVRGHWRYDKATRSLVPIGGETPAVVDAPTVMTDEIPPTQSHVTYNGPIFTSKRKLYDHYKANGVAIKEKGMLEKEPDRYKPDLKEIRETIAESYRQLKWNEYPLTEKEKAQCQKEMRDLKEYRKNH